MSSFLTRNLASGVFMACRRLATAPAVGSKAHIDGIIKNNKVVVFMKGTASQPLCGFSNVVVQIMKFHEVPFKDVNVMTDENLREGIKDYSNWPTIPQVYIDQEFVGGCDIMIEMHKNGDLVEQLAEAGIQSPHA